MARFDPREKDAKASGNAELLREVADHGPTLEQIVFSLCKIVCERLGECPVKGLTRDGFCVANWSACPHDARQPDVRDLVAAAEAGPKTASAVKPK